jgi:hypothetical protein
MTGLGSCGELFMHNLDLKQARTHTYFYPEAATRSSDLNQHKEKKMTTIPICEKKKITLAHKPRAEWTRWASI